MKHLIIILLFSIFYSNSFANTLVNFESSVFILDTLINKQWAGEYSPEIGCEGVSAGSQTVKISTDAKNNLHALYINTGIWQGESWDIKEKCLVVKQKDVVFLYKAKSGKKTLLMILRYISGKFEYKPDTESEWCGLEKIK